MELLERGLYRRTAVTIGRLSGNLSCRITAGITGAVVPYQ
jgi:hypothetical protein